MMVFKEMSAENSKDTHLSADCIMNRGILFLLSRCPIVVFSLYIDGIRPFNFKKSSIIYINLIKIQSISTNE